MVNGNMYFVILGERNQMNQATSYIDASFVYGVDDDSMNKLRLHKKGNTVPNT